MAFLFPLKNSARQALDILESHGYEAYVVGGCVRDFLMGTPPHDFDVCSAASPEDVKRIFGDFYVIPTGEKHGTITVMMEGDPLEITTFRKDGDYLDGRHPEQVQFTSAIEEDLMRRDFTVNAMAYSPVRGLKDPYGGQADLQKGILRCVGEAKRRFSEDALRILRALRFSARLAFEIEEKTADALHLLKDTLSRVSRERVAAEMNGLLFARDLKRVMMAFADVVVSALPGTDDLVGDGWEKTLTAVENAPLDLSVRWAALLCPLGEEAARAVLAGLKLSKALTEEACMLVRYAREEVNVARVCYMMSILGPERFEKLVLLQKALGECTLAEALMGEKNRILQTGACYTLSMLAVKGTDLKAAGVQGKMIGEGLQSLLQEVTMGRLPNEKEALLQALPRLLPDVLG